MATTSTVEQPQVTVRNIPQDQYNQNAGAVGTGGGGFSGSFQRHKFLWIGGGFAGLFALFLLWQHWNSTNGGLSNSTTDSGTGYGTGNSSPDQLWGSQLDADYQQLTLSMDANTSVLQQILNSMQNPSTSPPNNNGSTTPPTPFKPTFAGVNPLGGVNQLPAGTKVKYGANYQVLYELPGSSSWSLLDAPESWLESKSQNAYLPQNYIIQPGAGGSWWWRLAGTQTKGLLVPGSPRPIKFSGTVGKNVD